MLFVLIRGQSSERPIYLFFKSSLPAWP